MVLSEENGDPNDQRFFWAHAPEGESPMGDEAEQREVIGRV